MWINLARNNSYLQEKLTSSVWPAWHTSYSWFHCQQGYHILLNLRKSHPLFSLDKSMSISIIPLKICYWLSLVTSLWMNSFRWRRCELWSVWNYLFQDSWQNWCMNTLPFTYLHWFGEVFFNFKFDKLKWSCYYNGLYKYCQPRSIAFYWNIIWLNSPGIIDFHAHNLKEHTKVKSVPMRMIGTSCSVIVVKSTKFKIPG